MIQNRDAEPARTKELIKRFVGGGIDDERELDRIFRLLSKRLHPDLAGGDGNRFIRLREIYEHSKARMREREILRKTKGFNGGEIRGRRTSSNIFRKSTEAGEGEAGFDPYFIVIESGFTRSLEPRACLYLSLRRFYSLGIHNYRIRSMKGLKSRNSKVMRSIFHWSYIYDPDFPPIFAAYTRQHFQFLSTTWEVKNYNYARRLFSDGISGFFNYQYSGRRGTAEVSADNFAWTQKVLLRCVGEGHPLIPLASWFAAEIGKPPVFFEIST